MVKKIAIFGSCVSRDNFNSQFNSNYKDFFKCVLHQNQTSVLSLMSNPIPVPTDEEVEKLNDFNKWHLRTEFTKEFLKLIVERQPDYLIIDFYADLYFGVIDLGKGKYITNNSKFKNLPFYKNKNLKLDIETDTDVYMEIWKEKVDEFFKFIDENVSKCKVILNKTRFVDMTENGDSLTEIRKKNNIRYIDVKKLNSMWDKLDYYVIEKYDVGIIDQTIKEYKASTNHPWGQFYVHYTKDFYHDFLNKLIKLLFNDIEKELKQLNDKNRELEKKVRSFENESFIHVIKRYLLKNTYIKKVNDYFKGRTV